MNNSKAQRNLKMKSESKQIRVCIEMMNVQVLRVEDGKKTCHKNVQNPMPQAIPNITMGKIIPRYTYDWVYRHISHQETIKPRCPNGTVLLISANCQTLARGQSLLGLCQRGAGG